MSPRGKLALVAIQGSRTLQEYINRDSFDADASGELLINIFIPNTLYDGAVIARDNK